MRSECSRYISSKTPVSPSAHALARRASSSVAVRLACFGVSDVITGLANSRAATPCISWHVDACNYGKLELIDRLRPVAVKQTRQGAVREQPAASLTPRTVVRLVLRVHDALHGSAAIGAGLVVTAVHRHAFAKGCDLLGK